MGLDLGYKLKTIAIRKYLTSLAKEYPMFDKFVKALDGNKRIVAIVFAIVSLLLRSFGHTDWAQQFDVASDAILRFAISGSDFVTLVMGVIGVIHAQDKKAQAPYIAAERERIIREANKN